jgi:hypothetical protein
MFAIPDSEFLAIMNDRFPIQPCWRLARPTPQMLYKNELSVIQTITANGIAAG